MQDLQFLRVDPWLGTRRHYPLTIFGSSRLSLVSAWLVVASAARLSRPVGECCVLGSGGEAKSSEPRQGDPPRSGSTRRHGQVVPHARRARLQLCIDYHELGGERAMVKILAAIGSTVALAPVGAASAAGAAPGRSPDVQNVGITILAGDRIAEPNIALAPGVPVRITVTNFTTVPHLHRSSAGAERAHPSRPRPHRENDDVRLHAARGGLLRLALRHLPLRLARQAAHDGRHHLPDHRSLGAPLSRRR